MRRLALLLAGLVLALCLGEALLAGLDLPRFRAARSRPAQFAFVDEAEGPLLWTNVPSATIPFEYDGDPFGTLGAGARVEQHTGPRGFRLPDWEDAAAPGTFRVACIGDSFTFGEGVRDEDTLPEQLRRLLAARLDASAAAPEAGGAAPVEVLNLGVGGLNTVLERLVLERWALPARPDLVVLVFVLNDAEPPSFRRAEDGGVLALERGADFPKGGPEQAAPAGLLWRLRSARLAWKLAWSRARTQRTIDYYRALYAPDAPGWRRARRALEQMAAACRERSIPFVVALYPILVRLDAEHPLAGVHASVAQAARDAGAHVVDLLPAFLGRAPAELWVHPTDQHPNARAHALAARALLEGLEREHLLPASAATGAAR